MEHYVKSGVESTRDRKERAFRSRPLAAVKMTKLIDTEASHFPNAIEHKQAGNSTHHYLRRLHNYQMLWETGGSQTDIAGLSRHQIDLDVVSSVHSSQAHGQGRRQ